MRTYLKIAFALLAIHKQHDPLLKEGEEGGVRLKILLFAATNTPPPRGLTGETPYVPSKQQPFFQRGESAIGTSQRFWDRF